MDAYHNAKSILLKLVKEGYIAYFAGGWVRDYLMGHPSEDIDIATSAPPEKIMELFPNTIPVGLAFGIVIVVVKGHQFEVATFRKDLHYIDGRHPQGIVLSTPHEDALRRDFTINGMFYDPIEEVVHDHVHGQADIKLGVIRTIGDPHERFFEDRLRMLRAFRFSARFGFYIDPETQAAIEEHRDKFFPAVALERVWQEFNKMVTYPRFDQAIVEMHRLGLLDVIFPEIIGMHINELRHIVARFAHFPEKTPTILYLMELLPHSSPVSKIDASKRIKASNKDIKLLEYFFKLERATTKKDEVDAWQWAHLMANPHYPLCIEILAARDEERESFLAEYKNKYEQLQSHILRIQKSQPLVSSSLLREQGITPGKKMGALLKEAEKIAVNEDINDVKILLPLLMALPLWNQENEIN